MVLNLVDEFVRHHSAWLQEDLYATRVSQVPGNTEEESLGGGGGQTFRVLVGQRGSVGLHDAEGGEVLFVEKEQEKIISPTG